MSLPVAILAGGLATRMRPLTERVPKSLLEVAGRPFIEHQLRILREGGVERVVICVGHLGDQIRDAVGDGRGFGLAVSYSSDGDAPLGTGGAILRALPALGDAFLVLYGDSYLEVDYRAVETAFVRAGRPALMTVFRNGGRWDTSNVLVEGDRVARYDKRRPTTGMQFIDYGLGVLARRALAGRAEGERFDLADVYERLAAAGELSAWEAPKRFYEIGSPRGLEEARMHLARPATTEEGAVDSFTKRHLEETARIAASIDPEAVEKTARLIASTRDGGGRAFFLGVGGGAAHASHAVNDFRKLAAMECYAPTDNVSELTARTNDDGWETTFARWLEGSRLAERDLVFVISVGGGDLERNISPNLVRALEYAKSRGAKVCGIVGRDGGYTARVADACVVVPTVNPASVTPHTEAFQAVIWHLLVSHPLIQKQRATWETAARTP
jgi:D-sedoheptulose 7-phosphate isomerase